MQNSIFMCIAYVSSKNKEDKNFLSNYLNMHGVLRVK